MINFLTLRLLIVSNTLDMLLYMAIVYWLCGGGLASPCIKQWNLILFGCQLLFNFALCGWLIQQKQRGFRFLWINIFWLALCFWIFTNLQGY